MPSLPFISPCMSLAYLWMYPLSIAASQIILKLSSFRSWAWLSWVLWVSHKAAFRMWPGLPSSQSSIWDWSASKPVHMVVGGTQFLKGCLLDWSPQVLVSCHVGGLLTFFWGNEQVRECKWGPKIEATTFCKLISKTTHHSFWHILSFFLRVCAF